MLTSEALEKAKFPATKFREGYDVIEVDDFLDKLVATAKHYESGGTPAAAPMTSAEVASARFPATKFREGYDVVEVDALLDKAVAVFRSWEGGSAVSAAPGTWTQEAAAPVVADPAIVRPRRWWSRGSRTS